MKKSDEYIATNIESRKKIQIKKLGVLSIAKITGIIFAGIGFLFGIMFGLLGGLIGSIIGELTSGFGLGISGIIGFPIIYGVIGFITGAITAGVYNLASSRLGGIKMEVESVNDSGEY